MSDPKYWPTAVWGLGCWPCSTAMRPWLSAAMIVNARHSFDASSMDLDGPALRESYGHVWSEESRDLETKQPA
jgi:hypothetical protein